MELEKESKLIKPMYALLAAELTVTPPTVQGWVWSLSSDPQRPQLLYSGSWDASVRVWDVTVAKDVANIA